MLVLVLDALHSESLDTLKPALLALASHLCLSACFESAPQVCLSLSLSAEFLDLF